MHSWLLIKKKKKTKKQRAPNSSLPDSENHVGGPDIYILK